MKHKKTLVLSSFIEYKDENGNVVMDVINKNIDPTNMSIESWKDAIVPEIKNYLDELELKFGSDHGLYVHSLEVGILGELIS